MSDVATVAERALIGALLSDRDAVADVAERLAPEAFADDRRRLFYQAILSCWEDRVPPDPVTVSSRLLEFGYPYPEQDWADATEMMIGSPYGCHARHYADVVVAMARRRTLVEAAQRMAQQAALGLPDVDELLAQARRDAESFGAIATAGPVAYADAVPEWRRNLIDRWEGRIPPNETRTGFSALDERFGGGLRPGELVIVGARPGVGKSAFMLQLAHNAARHHRGKRVVVFSAEMSAEMLMARAASEISGLSYLAIKQRGLDPRLRERVLAASGVMEGLPVAIDDTSGITAAQVQVRVEREQRSTEVALVLFDYLELAGDEVRGDNEERRIATIVRRLKHVARVTDVPVVALSQLNREVERRGADARPKLADLRYSGAIEQNADIVLLLHRPDAEDKADGTNAEIIIAKHRNGPQGIISMRFNTTTMTFEEYGPGGR